MRVVDHEPGGWFLLEEDGALFLDGNYSYGLADYSWPMQLSPEETKQYTERGREFIKWLAHDVLYSVPIAKRSTSRYKNRRVSKEQDEKITETIIQWNKNRR